MAKSKTENQDKQQQGSQQLDQALTGKQQQGQGGSGMGSQETSEVQQSAQREGMGSHRHSNRGNEQALDATADVDDLGNHVKGAANSRADKKGS